MIRVGDQRITLSLDAIKSAGTVDIQSLKLNTDQEWDGKWRIVIWDIPEKRRRIRNIIRGVLKKLGFVGIQQSVWVSPWPCRDQISSLRDRLDLNPGLIFIETDQIEGSELLEEYFSFDTKVERVTTSHT